MIKNFLDRSTEDIFNGINSKEARKILPNSLWHIAQRKLEMIASAVTLNDLRVPPGNNLEELKGDRKGQHSICINDKYRICFYWTQGGCESVEIVNYHKG